MGAQRAPEIDAENGALNSAAKGALAAYDGCTGKDGRAGAHPPSAAGVGGWLDTYFRITERKSTVWDEVRGGIVAWMTMSYIIVVNPSILVVSGTPDNPLPFRSVATATCYCAAASCLIVGLWSNLPLGLMSGMGLNAYFAYGACRSLNVPWQVVLAGAMVHGTVLLALAMVGFCSWIQTLVPDSVKKALVVAIGVFQAFIGFQTMGVVVNSPLTLVTLGDVFTPKVYCAALGVLFIGVCFMCSVRGAMFLGIWAVTIASWALGLSPMPKEVVSWPTLDGTLFAADFRGLWDYPQMAGVIAAFLFVSIFDVAGVSFGICQSAGLLDEQKEVPRGKHCFASCGVGSIVGGIVGTSPVIIANETTAGIIEGARTGLAACVVAALFALSAVFAPLLEAVPPHASSVPLVIVGFFMMAPAKYIDWENTYEGLPAFLTVTVMPLTYSIANGVVAGLLSSGALALCVAGLRWCGVGVTTGAEPDAAGGDELRADDAARSAGGAAGDGAQRAAQQAAALRMGPRARGAESSSPGTPFFAPPCARCGHTSLYPRWTPRLNANTPPQHNTPHRYPVPYEDPDFERKYSSDRGKLYRYASQGSPAAAPGAYTPAWTPGCGDA